MDKERHLNGMGKGEFVYDYKHDMLTFRIRDRDYKMSIEFQNFIIDIDTEDFVTGIRIFDVSKISGLKKILFRNLVHGKFEALIKNNIVSIRINFVGRIRNKIIPIFCKDDNFTHQISTPLSSKYPIGDSLVTVPDIVVS